ncbi:YfhH family protein [Salipaludibacillus sp. CUR1]|uniref:YfhH family protein n=1 Tax=Salipaludibacillus sp. CUR1 TaxID=2820003 RepID=UPI001E294E1B|nr:YfhH family protein [Salipaludibacillus sp. CUR1]MCE7792244.1 YfhH family protein [Salipaludibacillus sp. CUR1]
MDKKYSQMSPAELQQEVADLKVKAQKAEQMGMINEFAVYERKMLMAQAYLMDPTDFRPGERYELKESVNEFFDIDYLNGIFAWGDRNGSGKQEAVPISVLGTRIK